MLEFLNSLPDYMLPYLWLMAIAVVLSLVTIIWYGMHAWHQHSVAKARKKRLQQRQLQL